MNSLQVRNIQQSQVIQKDTFYPVQSFLSGLIPLLSEEQVWEDDYFDFCLISAFIVSHRARDEGFSQKTAAVDAVIFLEEALEHRTDLRIEF